VRIPIAWNGDREVAWLRDGCLVEREYGGIMSTCVRNGVVYKRHHWNPDNKTCEHCGRVQGGEKNNVIGDSSGEVTELAAVSGPVEGGDLHGMYGGSDGLSVSTGQSGEDDDVARMSGEGGR
jgi:hypothetical protein